MSAAEAVTAAAAAAKSGAKAICRPSPSFLPSLFLRLSLSFSLSQTCMQINISCNAWKVSLYIYSGFLHPSFKPAGTKGIAYTSSKRKLDP